MLRPCRNCGALISNLCPVLRSLQSCVRVAPLPRNIRYPDRSNPATFKFDNGPSHSHSASGLLFDPGFCYSRIFWVSDGCGPCCAATRSTNGHVLDSPPSQPRMQQGIHIFRIHEWSVAWHSAQASENCPLACKSSLEAPADAAF